MAMERSDGGACGAALGNYFDRLLAGNLKDFLAVPIDENLHRATGFHGIFQVGSKVAAMLVQTVTNRRSLKLDFEKVPSFEDAVNARHQRLRCRTLAHRRAPERSFCAKANSDEAMWSSSPSTSRHSTLAPRRSK